MDPIDISCPKCGRIFLYGRSCPSNKCNVDSTSFLDKVAKERKTPEEYDGKSTNIESDFTAYDLEEFQKDSILLHSSKEDPLISAVNPPIPSSIGKNFLERNKQDFVEVTGAFANSFEYVPDSLPIIHIDTLYLDESTTFFPRSRNPLDGLQLEPLVTDDSSVSDQRKDKIVKTEDSRKKQSETSDADIAKAIRDLRIETTSEDYYGCSALDPSEGNNELQRTFECSSLVLPSCSHSGPPRSDRKGHSKSKSKKSPLKHSPKKIYQCGECGNRLSTRQGYKRHQLRMHKGDKPYECKNCGRTFFEEYELKAHHRRHSGTCIYLPFKCMLCSMRFPNTSSLETHFLLHMDERLFVCPTCGRPFTRQSNLNRHRRNQTH